MRVRILGFRLRVSVTISQHNTFPIWPNDYLLHLAILEPHSAAT